MKEAIEGPKHLPLIDAAGEFFGFVWEGLRGLRFVGGYTAEVMRQIGLLVAGSVLVIVFISFIAGARAGSAAEAIGQALALIAWPHGSAPSARGARRAVRVRLHLVAAKVGGGNRRRDRRVRANEEVDALQLRRASPRSPDLVSDADGWPRPSSCRSRPVDSALGMGALVDRLRRPQRHALAGHREFVFYTDTSPSDPDLSHDQGVALSTGVDPTALYSSATGRGVGRSRSGRRWRSRWPLT